MANLIVPAERYVPILDEVYLAEAKSAVLDSESGLLQWMSDVQTFRVAKMTMSGLGDYSRANGYPAGDVTIQWQAHAPDWDRGRMFTVDTMDDEEAAGLAYAKLAGNFIRERVTPELDAFRFARYAGVAITANSSASAQITSAQTFRNALRAAVDAMDDKEVPEDGRYLFTTPALLGGLEDMDTTASREVLSRFADRIRVPQRRFYTAIELLDGAVGSDFDGGYRKAALGKPVNFLIVHKPAVMQTLKHVAPKIISATENQLADGWKYGYRAYGLCDTYDNKAGAGLYVHFDGR